MNDIAIHSKLKGIWDQYNQVRLAGDKKNANLLLADYIDLLKQQHEEIIKMAVDNICSRVLDTDNKIISNNGTEVSEKDIRIQHPLFRELILPRLKDQYKCDSAKHIKWIGQLEQFFYSDHKATDGFLKELNIEGYFHAIHFFEKSFAIDNNQKTLTLLLNRITQDINYYTHEVPLGVLVDPEVLDDELRIFKKYWQQSETKDDWQNDLEEWEKIAKYWRLYHVTQGEYHSFENYLEKKGIQLD